jgi:hypothetical protein
VPCLGVLANGRPLYIIFDQVRLINEGLDMQYHLCNIYEAETLLELSYSLWNSKVKTSNHPLMMYLRPAFLCWRGTTAGSGFSDGALITSS